MRAQSFQWIARGEPFPKKEDCPPGSFPPILEHLVRQRGLPEGMDLETYLHPRLMDLSDPFLIPGMAKAVERILEAIDQGQEICIYGDYDVDGVTSITLMRRILTAYGLDPRHFIPKRGPEGYGLSDAAIERCMAEGVKPDLMITVDCGTVSVPEVALLRADGVDVVIVDHHEPLPGDGPDSSLVRLRMTAQTGDRQITLQESVSLRAPATGYVTYSFYDGYTMTLPY